MFTEDRLPGVYPEPDGRDFDSDNSWLLLACAMGFAAPEYGYTECPFPDDTVSAFIWYHSFHEADQQGIPLRFGFFSEWLHDGRIH